MESVNGTERRGSRRAGRVGRAHVALSAGNASSAEPCAPTRGRPDALLAEAAWCPFKHPTIRRDQPAYATLMEKYQEFNPLKLIVDAAQADQAVPQVAEGPPAK